ncbi:uncharacterized protein EI97DRAFT_236344 [Westerdykella ornata]|uniref:Uncharacterized protein n=1 Tax=Westerdykella ornata TaxID=318751 RepID=A0A6A6J8X7_WESOR|nr:uncharacterized protein EI97DRAFT_236344 [Westerdykella ornata]KAF2272096.1 hypothetical protein EI97DRAFT_236344 [Westerdykella ornata]
MMGHIRRHVSKDHAYRKTLLGNNSMESMLFVSRRHIPPADLRLYGVLAIRMSSAIMFQAGVLSLVHIRAIWLFTWEHLSYPSCATMLDSLVPSQVASAVFTGELGFAIPQIAHQDSRCFRR